MIGYLARRFFWTIPTLIGISLITFFIIKLAPGDPSRQFERSAGQVSRKTETQQTETRQESPRPVRFVRRRKRPGSFVRRRKGRSGG